MMNKSWVFPVEKWSDYPQGKQAVATGVRPAEATKYHEDPEFQRGLFFPPYRRPLGY